MSFTIRELLDTILERDLDNSEKSELLERIYTKGRITDDLFLRRNHGTPELECWASERNEKGQIEEWPTNLDAVEVIDEYERLNNIKSVRM